MGRNDQCEYGFLVCGGDLVSPVRCVLCGWHKNACYWCKMFIETQTNLPECRVCARPEDLE